MNTPADSDSNVAAPAVLNKKQIIAALIFLAIAIGMAQVVPTVEIAWVTAILLFTIYLFAFEVVGVDVAAATVMVLLGLTTLLAPVLGLDAGLVDLEHLFDGFGSNAVISIIAVMIIGAGLDKTGLMSRLASFILRIGGRHAPSNGLGVLLLRSRGRRWTYRGVSRQFHQVRRVP